MNLSNIRGHNLWDVDRKIVKLALGREESQKEKLFSTSSAYLTVLNFEFSKFEMFITDLHRMKEQIYRSLRYPPHSSRYHSTSYTSPLLPLPPNAWQSSIQRTGLDLPEVRFITVSTTNAAFHDPPNYSNLIHIRKWNIRGQERS